MPNFFGKLSEFILNMLIIIVFVILVLAGTYMVQTQVLHYDYANIFGYTAFQVSTGSMVPTIEIEDIVLVKIQKDINQDDIIVFKDGQDLITHRVVDVDNDRIITKGDANNSEDKQIQKSQVIGKVIKIFINVAIWKKVFFTPEVFISITVAILLFGLAFSYKGDKTENNKDFKDNKEKKEGTKER